MRITINADELKKVEARLRRSAEHALLTNKHSGKKLIVDTMRAVGNQVAGAAANFTSSTLPGGTKRIFNDVNVYRVKPRAKGRHGQDIGVWISGRNRWSKKGRFVQDTLQQALELGGGATGDRAADQQTAQNNFRRAIEARGGQRNRYIAWRIAHLMCGTTGTQPLKAGGKRNVYARYGRQSWMDDAADMVLPVAAKQITNTMDAILQDSMFVGQEATWHKNRLGGRLISGGSTFGSIVSGGRAFPAEVSGAAHQARSRWHT